MRTRKIGSTNTTSIEALAIKVSCCLYISCLFIIVVINIRTWKLRGEFKSQTAFCFIFLPAVSTELPFIVTAVVVDFVISITDTDVTIITKATVIIIDY